MIDKEKLAEFEIKELKFIIKKLGYFPTQRELFKMKRSDLSHAIQKHGGFNYFREILGYEIFKHSDGYWNEENIIIELKLIIEELDHFPTNNDLIKMKRTDLSGGIQKHGGFLYFRKLLGYKPLRKTKNYWTKEENIIKELKPIIKELNHFPTPRELIKMERGDLATAISSHGGYPHFRELLGHKIIQHSLGYWNEENIIKELKPIIKKLGDFPRDAELREMDRNDLEGAIQNNGGILYFRNLLGYKPLQKPGGYWNEKSVIAELKLIIEKLGVFPTVNDLIKMERIDLSVAIQKHGGFFHFWEIFNVDITEKMKIKSEKMSYINKRGTASEKIVRPMIEEWCKAHGLPAPKFNVKLAKSKIIEFLCEGKEKIGVDITNFEGKNSNGIRHKWHHKEYQNHLGELWIVVFNNDYNPDDYIKLNENSPDNVKVMSIYTFIRELNITIDENLKFRIDVYNKCTFHTKRELKSQILKKKSLPKVLNI